MKMLERHYEQLTADIPNRHEIEAVEITPAARWFYEENNQEVWSPRDDFPILTPPFPMMWLEFACPKRSSSTVATYEFPANIERFGCMVATIKVKEEHRAEVVLDDLIMRSLGQHVLSLSNSRQVLPARSPEDRVVIEQEIDESGGAAWWTAWKAYIETRAHKLHEMPLCGMYLSRDGRSFSRESYVGPMDRLGVFAQDGRHPGSWMLPYWFAVSLMHAKNVTTEVLEAPDRVVRKREKQGKTSLRFKMLVVNSLRNSVSSGPGTGTTGIRRALHFVRGHFKDYREHGLFGRSKGIYWWDMHARGNESAGKIIKDYSVVAPDPARGRL